MYDELVAILRRQCVEMVCGNCNTCVNRQAADAIEELSKELLELKLLTCCCGEPPKEVLTGTDMRGGIRRDDAGNVIDWGIAGPPGDVGKTEEE